MCDAVYESSFTCMSSCVLVQCHQVVVSPSRLAGVTEGDFVQGVPTLKATPWVSHDIIPMFDMLPFSAGP